MYKLLMFFALCMSLTYNSTAQENKNKVKQTSTVPQKVHNIFSRHKEHSGYKSKREKNGIRRKHKVNYKNGTIKNKKSLS